MRIGVIRGDMQGPISIMDVEAVSQHNPPTEPRGQERRFGRPTLAGVNAALSANIPAGLEGTVDIHAGLTITGTNNDLKLKTKASAGLSTVTIAQAAYTSGFALVKAINAAVGGMGAGARLSDDGLHVVLFSTTKGEGSYFEVGTSGLASAIGVSGNFTIPAVGSIITDTLPVGGPLNISETALRTKFGNGASDAQLSAFADSIAPRIIETDAAIKSFQVGMIAGFRSNSYNPDPSRHPALTSGPAIAVVQDDGSTPFVAPMTEVTTVTAASGALTVNGTNLGSPEVEQTVVRVLSADENKTVKLFQRVIQTAGGSVSPTKIIIPASLLAGLGISGSKVRVQYTSFTSGQATVA